MGKINSLHYLFLIRFGATFKATNDYSGKSQNIESEDISILFLQLEQGSCRVRTEQVSVSDPWYGSPSGWAGKVIPLCQIQQPLYV